MDESFAVHKSSGAQKLLSETYNHIYWHSFRVALPDEFSEITTFHQFKDHVSPVLHMLVFVQVQQLDNIRMLT